LSALSLTAGRVSTSDLHPASFTSSRGNTGPVAMVIPQGQWEGFWNELQIE
jgi:hypothetical protein